MAAVDSAVAVVDGDFLLLRYCDCSVVVVVAVELGLFVSLLFRCLFKYELGLGCLFHEGS